VDRVVVFATLLLGPSLLVFLVRLAALGMGCEPGPDFCRGMALGAGLRDALGLAGSSGRVRLRALQLQAPPPS
jgi:hypothetical protein